MRFPRAKELKFAGQWHFFLQWVFPTAPLVSLQSPSPIPGGVGPASAEWGS